jgi:hypothetical protein
MDLVEQEEERQRLRQARMAAAKAVRDEGKVRTETTELLGAAMAASEDLKRNRAP